MQALSVAVTVVGMYGTDRRTDGHLFTVRQSCSASRRRDGRKEGRKEGRKDHATIIDD